VNFVALLLGLGIERLLTNLFHLREFRWLDPWIDRVYGRLANASMAGAVAGICIYAFVAVLPVALVAGMQSGTLLQIPYFLLAIVVLLLSLGPRDLITETNDYCAAVQDGREQDELRIIRALREGEAPPEQYERLGI